MLFVISSFVCSGQEIDSASADVIEYNELNNYIPKSLINDTVISLSIGKVNDLKFNSIVGLYFLYIFQDDFKLDSVDIHILENRITILVTALVREKKFVFINRVGGYAGCPDKMLIKKKQNGFDVTFLNYCYSCTNFTQYDSEFISMFNDRMYRLMGLEPPDVKTHLFYGEFKGLGNSNSGINLILTENGEFKYKARNGNYWEFSQGYWINKMDTLILNSEPLNKTNCLPIDLQNAKWIEVSDLEFLLKKEKLLEIKNRKRKLKKL